MGKERKNLYVNVQNVIKNAKIQKYFRERDEISKEGLTFLGYFNKKNDFYFIFAKFIIFPSNIDVMLKCMIVVY